MKSDGNEYPKSRRGSLFRYSISDFKTRFQSIELKLLQLIVDDAKRLASLPEQGIIIWDEERRENIPGQFTITAEELNKSLPKEINSYYLESVEKLNELGNTYQSKWEEEKVLCKKLIEFKKVRWSEDYDEDTQTMHIIIESPIKQFIKENHAEIINIRKRVLDNYKPLKETVYLESEKEYVTKYNTVESFVCLNKLRASELEKWLKFFEDGAIKYPRLIHVVLEWPLLSPMPKPPRELLDYCEPEEYEYMLKRRGILSIIDSCFSTPETQSTAWFIYPNGESWCKESGIKLFQELFCDINFELSCNWEALLHSYGLTMSHGNNHHLCYDGWDGLFDEDYFFYSDKEGRRNGLYNCYYITDVFYESVRLCRYLLNNKKEGKEKDVKEYLEIFQSAAEQAAVEEIRIIYEVVEFLWRWIKSEIPDNAKDFTPRWVDLGVKTTDRMEKVIYWLKWQRSELAQDVETEYKELLKWANKGISKNAKPDSITKSISMAQAYAVGLASKLKNVAELAKRNPLTIEGKTQSGKPTEPEQEDKSGKKQKAKTWDEITIDFVDNDTIKYKVNDKNWERANYTQLGFLDNRKNKANILWPIFSGLAKKNLPPTINRPKMKPKDIDRICFTLRKFFGIEERPIEYNKRTKEYLCKFTFHDPRDWNTTLQNENLDE